MKQDLCTAGFRPELIAVDMDGTLLSPEGRIPPENAGAVRLAQKQGIRILICTGRSPRDAFLPMREAGICCEAFCFNGAVLCDADGTVLNGMPLSGEAVRIAEEIAAAHGLFPDAMTEKEDLTTASRNMFSHLYEAEALLPTASIGYDALRKQFQFLEGKKIFESGRSIYKLSLISEKHRNGKLTLSEARKELLETGLFSVSSSADNNLEITAAGISKGSALSGYAAEHGILLAKTAAIGDSENDLSMMQLPLGRKIAMGNAAACIKAAADEISASNMEAGVAQAILRMSGEETGAARVLCVTG
ncbi:MAG: Cof-type HAD-IIB family hydrolase [Eubacteriales bacterium]|nr:Cof-type HAD-IIB family hydrolase [Eubacteriales bacterium]